MEIGVCQTCGETHDELAFAVPVRLPTLAMTISHTERESRVWSNGELCVIDDRRFYLYGAIEIPIHNHSETFVWGAWVELIENDFFAYQDLLEVEGRESNPPFKARLGTDIAFYEPTLDLPLIVEIMPCGERPVFRLTAGTHTLISDQTNGIGPARIEEIKEWLSALNAGSDA